METKERGNKRMWDQVQWPPGCPLSYNREGLSLEKFQTAQWQVQVSPASTVLDAEGTWTVREMKGYDLSAPYTGSQAHGKTWLTWMSSSNLWEQSWPSSWVGFSPRARLLWDMAEALTSAILFKKIFLAILSPKTLSLVAHSFVLGTDLCHALFVKQC